MKFNKKNLFSFLNMDKLKPGARGYFGRYIAHIKNAVEDGDKLETLKAIDKEREEEPFYNGRGFYGWSQFFYLVEDTEGAKNGD